jgi:hypothetical protein
MSSTSGIFARKSFTHPSWRKCPGSQRTASGSNSSVQRALCAVFVISVRPAFVEPPGAACVLQGQGQGVTGTQAAAPVFRQPFSRARRRRERQRIEQKLPCRSN